MTDQTSPFVVASAERVLVEFVSADPNGPLSVWHGRCGVVGDCLASLLSLGGADVTREFYVNDATIGKQMNRFARAVHAEVAVRSGHDAPASDNEYPPQWIHHVAEAIRPTLAHADFATIARAASRVVRHEQEDDLDALGVRFDHIVFESSLHARGAVHRVLNQLQASGNAYAKSGGLWLSSSKFGDEADRPLVRADGTPTYLAGDLAYHADKFARGYDRLINVWKHDHADYIVRTRAGLLALGLDASKLHVVLVAPVRVLRDGTEVKGNLPGANAVALRDLLATLGKHNTRLALLGQATHDRSVDVDMDKAVRQDRTNPAWVLEGVTSKEQETRGEGNFAAFVQQSCENLSVVPVLQAALSTPDIARVAAPLLLGDLTVPFGKISHAF
jgi:arginyl-tRNA synthetase